MRTPDLTLIDDTERERFFFDADMVLHRYHDSPLEDRIHAENRALASINRSFSFGRVELRMSMAEYLYLLRLYPELRPGADRQARERRWRKIAWSSDYRAIQVGK